MTKPQISRPGFPPGYVEDPQAWMTWEMVEEKLVMAVHYWLCTVRPDGRPHAIPKWGVWVGGKFYCDGSPETRHARNLASNPHTALHLESGAEVVIVEGECRALSAPERPLAQRVAAAYTAKYSDLGYAPAPDQWDEGGLFALTPRKALAWTSFTDDPTRFTFGLA